jgi:tetratricopeptide (TPR) repeat protein
MAKYKCLRCDHIFSSAEPPVNGCPKCPSLHVEEVGVLENIQENSRQIATQPKIEHRDDYTKVEEPLDSRRKIVTILAEIATIVAAIFAFFVYFYPRQQSVTIEQSLGLTEPIPPRKAGVTRILVAKFDGADESNYRVTEIIITNMQFALSKYPSTEVVGVNRVITESEGSDYAIKLGEAYDASIVIWGWHGLTDKTVPIGVHFEVIPSSESSTADACPASSTQIRREKPSELSDLTLQTNLSNELSAVTIFTLSLERFKENDWSGSTQLLTDAIVYLDSSTSLTGKTIGNGILVNEALIYFYRAEAYYLLGNYDAALSDLEEIGLPISDDLAFHYLIGDIYLRQGEYQQSLEHFDRGIKKQPSGEILALLYYLRGSAYDGLSMFDLARSNFIAAFTLDDQIEYVYTFQGNSPNDVADFSEMIDKNPSHFPAYYFRAIANYFKGNIKDSFPDLIKAIEIYPNFYAARQMRAQFRLIEPYYYNPELQIADYEAIFAIDKYRNPCNHLNLGNAYRRIGKEDLAISQFYEAVSKATEEINLYPEDAAAYYVRGLTYDNLGEEMKALKDLRKAKKLDPSISVKYRSIDEVITKIENRIRGIISVVFCLVVLLPLIVWVLIQINRDIGKPRPPNEGDIYYPRY